MKKTKRFIVIALCAVIVACSAVSPVKVDASSVNPSRIVDVALTRTGIVANKSILKAVEDKLVDIVRDTLELYDAWLDENPSKEVSTETFNEFVDGGGLSTFAYRAIAPYLNRKFVKAVMQEYREALDEAPVDIGEVLTGEKSLLGVIISLPSELVNFIRSLFDEYEAENADYYYIDTYSHEDVNPIWFDTAQNYNNFCYALKNYDGLLHFMANSSNGSNFKLTSEYPIYYWKMYLMPNNALFVKQTPSEYVNWELRIYNENWDNPVNVMSNASDYIETTNFVNISDFETAFITEKELTYVKDTFGKKQKTGSYAYCGIWTSDGRPVKVFNSLSAMKNHTVGNQPYYVNNNALNYEKFDNSVNIGGDWLESTNYSYSHDVVQNEINNTENVDNSVVNNIVNNNVTNITNNYASTTTPDNGDNGNGSGGGLGSILDGLGSIISAITDIVGFLLGVIGDVIGLIGQLFTVVFNGLKALGTLIGEFPKLLGEIFVFIPEELINFLILAIEASIGIAIWRKFSKK